MAIKPTFTKSDLDSSRLLQEQLERLKYYIDLLRKEAKYLGNEQSDLNADKLQQIADSSNLEAITEALLTIEKKKVQVDSEVAATNAEVTSGQVIRVAKGYYDKDTVLTVQSLSDSSKVDNAPNADEIVAGKQAWANGVKITGTLADNSGKTVEATESNKDAAKENNNITIKVSPGKYTEDSVIDTGIVARTTYSYDAEVSVSTDEEGAEHAKVKAFDIPAGYYDKPISIYPVFKDGADYESVINVKDLSVEHSGVFDPHAEKTADNNGFDYYSKVTVLPAEVKSSASLDVAKAEATVSITSKGYTDEDSYKVTLPTKVAPSAVDAEVSAVDANVSITPAVNSEQSVTIPAGLYTKDTVIKVSSMAAGDKVTSDNISVKETPVINATKEGYTVNVLVDKSGYIAAGDYVASDLAKSSISITNVADSVVNSKVFAVSNKEGYTKGETINLSVQDATFEGSNIAIAKNSIKITPTTAGWYEGNTFNLTGQVNTVVDQLATTSDALFTYDDVKDIANGKNTSKYAAGEGVYYKKAETDLTDLVTALASL